MTDTEAIRLFEADGGIAGEWHCVDEVVRNHWRKVAMEAERDTLEYWTKLLNGLFLELIRDGCKHVSMREVEALGVLMEYAKSRIEKRACAKDAPLVLQPNMPAQPQGAGDEQSSRTARSALPSVASSR